MADRRAVRSSSRRISPTPQPLSRHILPATTRPTQRNAKRAAGGRGHEAESIADRASLGLAPRGTPRGQKTSTGSGQRSERKRSRPSFDPKKSWVLELLSNFLAKLINNYSGYTQRQSASWEQDQSALQDKLPPKSQLRLRFRGRNPVNKLIMMMVVVPGSLPLTMTMTMVKRDERKHLLHQPQALQPEH